MAADVALAFQTWRHVMSPMAASEATAFGAIRVETGLAGLERRGALTGHSFTPASAAAAP